MRDKNIKRTAFLEDLNRLKPARKTIELAFHKSLGNNVYTVVHDFNGHEVDGIHGLYGKKGYDEALYSVNKRHDITGIHDINGNFPYDDIFRKNHARLYFGYSTNL